MFMVTNDNDFTFTAKFNSKEFEFPAGQHVYCDDDAARHIFALGKDDKSSILMRHGWVKPYEPAEKGLEILSKFKFEHMLPNYDAPMAQRDLNDHGKAPVVQSGAAGHGADAPTPVAPVEELPTYQHPDDVPRRVRTPVQATA
jgi:hypothetical protein